MLRERPARRSSETCKRLQNCHFSLALPIIESIFKFIFQVQRKCNRAWELNLKASVWDACDKRCVPPLWGQSSGCRVRSWVTGSAEAWGTSYIPSSFLAVMWPTVTHLLMCFASLLHSHHPFLRTDGQMRCNINKRSSGNRTRHVMR